MFSLLLPMVAYGTDETAAPTIPTPFPTVTPAPESQCDYKDADKGPFALDCLQAAFIDKGCSVRGQSYPTNTRMDADRSDKKWYNAWDEGRNWKNVLDQLDIVVADTLGCRGSPTPVPTNPPTRSPTSIAPTPLPTLPPTDQNTPAPTYHDEHVWTRLADVGAAEAADATAIEDECKRLGYQREYDETRYVIRLEMQGYFDYYTTTAENEICDLVKDPTAVPLLWSDRVTGPFHTMTTADVQTFTIEGFMNGEISVTRTNDGRAFSSWLTTSGTGGYGSTDPANGENGGAVGQAYTLAISTFRENFACTERKAPQTAVFDSSPAFSSPCDRSGTVGQDWSPTAPICAEAASTDNTKLLYAIANRQFGTCDSVCVWSLDYDENHADENGKPTNGADFWFWSGTGDAACWKPTSAYTEPEFMMCDVNHDDFESDVDFAWRATESERLCVERCNLSDGWFFAMGSCYRVSPNSEYSGDSTADHVDLGKAACQATLASGTAYLASINSAKENALVVEVCGGECYFGGITGYDSFDGAFDDGTVVTWVNWETNESTDTADIGSGKDSMVIMPSGVWVFKEDNLSLGVVCETEAVTTAELSGRNQAEKCLFEDTTAADEILGTASYPKLDVVSSGFRNPSLPGTLILEVTVPKTMYDIGIRFENSTNDAAQYSWNYWDSQSFWELTDDDDDCDNDYTLTGSIKWTTFYLGGAGGVERLATWEEGVGEGANLVHEPNESKIADGSGTYYQFGATMHISALQPLFTSVDTGDAAEARKRDLSLTRSVVVRVPFILRFQKTITVTVDVNVVSTKFNYKTVAAIIQSIQYDTRYFEPPYASVKLQIRTKSQYPYLFNDDAANTVKLYVGETEDSGENENVDLALVHLHDDVNCTFTNPDHMREGDICTQEWMLTIVPHDNVCYATGEYSIEYTAGCFHGKDVCYLPQDESGDDIDKVTFTFQLQTSKFCPEVADEVDLSGTIEVTGRESFKPTEEGVEDDTDGSFYMQGETIHLFATTNSAKAQIIATEVIMVELVQDLSGLVQTGFNRVPYDDDFEDITIWMSADAQGTVNGVRVADGSLTVDDGAIQTDVVLMTDTDVYASGSIFSSDTTRSGTQYVFAPTECGFKLVLHARAFPVNVDSFGSKTVVATLQVQYEALESANSIGRRRRLLAAGPTFDMRASTEFSMRSWAPESMPIGLGKTASMALELTLNSQIDRSNSMMFAHSVHSAIVTSLNQADSANTAFEEQVVIDAIFSDGIPLWTKPYAGQVSSRRLLAGRKKLRVEFTFGYVKKPNSMPVNEMIRIFDSQIRSPASPLMNQPVFFGSVLHSVQDIGKSDSFDDLLHSETLESASTQCVPLVALFAVIALVW